MERVQMRIEGQRGWKEGRDMHLTRGLFSAAILVVAMMFYPRYVASDCLSKITLWYEAWTNLVASAWLAVASFTSRSMVSMEARRIFEAIQ